MFSATRKIEFDAAHRIKEHDNMCRMLHGHRYVIEASFMHDSLDDMGMVIDFSEIKTILEKWVFTYWDHNTILSKEDRELGDYIEKITGQKVFYLDSIPTAENMALYLLKEVCPELFKNLRAKCAKIRLYETPNCYVEVVE